jgi:hypothetical protein
MEIDSTLIKLREVTGEINRATDDTRMKAILEKTWLLQDRLAFPRQVCHSILMRYSAYLTMCLETRCCLKESDSFLWTCSIVRSASCLLAEQVGDHWTIHDLSFVP